MMLPKSPHGPAGPCKTREGTPKGVLEIAGENLIHRIVSPRYWERLKGDAAAFLQYS